MHMQYSIATSTPRVPAPREHYRQPLPTTKKSEGSRRRHSTPSGQKAQGYKTALYAILNALPAGKSWNNTSKLMELLGDERAGCGHRDIDLVHLVLEQALAPKTAKAQAIVLLLHWNLRGFEIFQWNPKTYRHYLAYGIWIKDIQKSLAPCLQELVAKVLLLNLSASKDTPQTERYVWFIRHVRGWFKDDHALHARLTNALKEYEDI